MRSRIVRTIVPLLLLTVVGQQLTGTAIAGGRWKAVRAPSMNLSFPYSVALDRHGVVYVADTYHHCIRRLSSRGQPLASWGTKGRGRGQFLFPQGIAVDGGGNLYVVDSFNDRIQKLSPTGKVLAVWGSFGSRPGQFRSAQDIAVDRHGNVYVLDVVDRDHARVEKFSSAGKPLASLSVDRAVFITLLGFIPAGLAVDARGNIYAGITTAYSSYIVKLSPRGELLGRFGARGDGLGEFQRPGGLALDAHGDVYVTDYYDGHVEELSPTNQPLAEWGEFGSDPGQFSGPTGLAIDPAGDIYVADSLNSRIQKLSPIRQRITIWQ